MLNWYLKQQTKICGGFFTLFAWKKSDQGIEYRLKKVEKTSREREMCKLQLHFQMGFTCHFASVLMTVSGDMNSFYGFPYFFFRFAHRQTDRENNEMYLFAVCISVQCKWWLQSGEHHSDVDHLISQWGQIFNYPPNSIHFNEIYKSNERQATSEKKFLFCLQNIHLRQNGFDFLAI